VLRDARVKPMDLRELILVGGMTRMPKIQQAVREWFKREPCTTVNPDEVVALGAAVHASALTEEANETVLLDVTPLSLGVAVAGGYVRKLIPRNTTVPTSVTEVFNTSKDNQTMVKILVLQGEHEVAHQNELLGEFILTGLREGRRSEVEVEVTFEINSEGIVSVSARDRATGAAQSIKVAASGGLTRGELFDIMDAEADNLLESKATHEIGAKREELRVLLAELTPLIPKVSGALKERANNAVQAGTHALEKGTLGQVVQSVEVLTRTVAVIQVTTR
jgi:molecular chaperone DnaK